MKKILALLIGIYPFASYSAGLPIDFSKEGKYSSATWNGVTYMFHPSLLDDRDEALKAYRYVVKIFSEVERVIPKTVSHFKKQKCKIVLYELENTRGGMEYVRSGQSEWDPRINPKINHSILIPRAYSYSQSGHKGMAYLLHEMIHFHHIDILTLNGDTPFDKELKRSYALAVRNPKYRGVYASSNYLEYFAEISTAYLLESHRTSKFPKGSKELYIHDRVGYNLCKSVFGEKAAAYTPLSKPVRVATVAPYGMTRNPSVPSHNPHCRCTQCSTGHATKVFKIPTDESVLMSKKFLEIVYLINKAEIESNDRHAHWLLGNALDMLEKFKREYPNHRVALVNQMITSIKARIN
jgi:hypothetical protein